MDALPRELSCIDVPAPKIATAGELERAWDKEFRACLGRRPEQVRIDLSQCEFIDVAGLILLIAYLGRLYREKVALELRLPRDRRVRDFLRVWDFPTAIRDAVGCSFRSLVSHGDIQYFGESRAVTSMFYAGSLATIEGTNERLLSRDF